MVLASHMVNLSLGNADLLASIEQGTIAPLQAWSHRRQAMKNSTAASEILEPYSAFFDRSWRPGLLPISQTMAMVAARSPAAPHPTANRNCPNTINAKIMSFQRSHLHAFRGRHLHSALQTCSYSDQCHSESRGLAVTQITRPTQGNTVEIEAAPSLAQWQMDARREGGGVQSPTRLARKLVCRHGTLFV